MITLRLATAVATLVGSSALFADCEPEEPACPASAPEEGCACEIEEETGCTADGEWHYEAYVCVDGVWTDTAGTTTADTAFCGGPDAYYGGCYYNEETGAIEVACAVPGFIGIGKSRKARRAARSARPRRLRAAA